MVSELLVYADGGILHVRVQDDVALEALEGIVSRIVRRFVSETQNRTRQTKAKASAAHR